MSNQLRRKAKKKEPQEISVLLIATKAGQWVVGIYLLLMLGIFPLYFQDKYYDMGDAKYFFFQIATSVLFFALLIPAAVTGAGVLRKKKKPLFMVTDWIVIAYLLLAVLSWVLSKYRGETWIGSNEWYMGLKSQLLFGVIYFAVSRFGTDRQWPLWVLGFSTACAFMIAYLHRFMVDPLGLYEGIDEYYKVLFLGTFGQASWYSSYVAVVLPVFMGLYMFGIGKGEKNGTVVRAFLEAVVRVLLGALIFLGFGTAVTQNSDSVYIGLGLAFLFLFWFALENVAGWKRFLEVCLLGIAAAKFTGILQLVFPERVPELDTLSLFVTQSALGWIVLAVLVVLYGMTCIVLEKRTWPIQRIRPVRRGFYILIAVAVACLPVVVWGVTAGWLNIGGGVLSETGYLTFSEKWGNGRGKTWMYAAEIFREYSLPMKLFGCGPDAMTFYNTEFHAEEIQQMWGGLALTNAHNEWFTALLNFGILGASAYLAIFISFIVMVVKNWKLRPECICAGAAVLSYIGHNFFCYQQAVCTPMVFLVMGAAVYRLRRKRGRDS